MIEIVLVKEITGNTIKFLKFVRFNKLNYF